MKINERLYNLRTQKQLSAYKLSKISGVSVNHIHNLENGSKSPKIDTLLSLLDALNITPSEFFNDEQDEVTYLSDGEKKILELYRHLPKDKADILIEFYKKMITS